MKTKLPLLQFKRACNKLQGASKSLATLLLFSILFFSSKTIAQIGTGTAPVLKPTGGFAIDGNLKANTSVGDWLQGTGAGGFVLDGTAAGNPIDASTTFHLTDLYNSGMDDNFKAGLKVCIISIPQLLCVCLNANIFLFIFHSLQFRLLHKHGR